MNPREISNFESVSRLDFGAGIDAQGNKAVVVTINGKVYAFTIPAIIDLIQAANDIRRLFGEEIPNQMIPTNDGNYEFVDEFKKRWSLRISHDPSYPMTISEI